MSWQKYTKITVLRILKKVMAPDLPVVLGI